ncbi:MAG TPA: hypothetical protein VK184_04455 [Nostocaceae cyanobacterium]|nr:hypothetical protein [Nostocaceae cyanobacterium]
MAGIISSIFLLITLSYYDSSAHPFCRQVIGVQHKTVEPFGSGTGQGNEFPEEMLQVVRSLLVVLTKLFIFLSICDLHGDSEKFIFKISELEIP